MSLKIATWNVNGIRARKEQFESWVQSDRPDVICLQEIKASISQVPESLLEMEGYWCYWHGAGGYSGVALLVRKETCPKKPEFSHPEFDHETRIVTARLPEFTVASVYVPNGGKDFAAKMRFFEALDRYVGERRASGEELVLCGDINIARSDMDVHAKERKIGVIGQLPEERELFERLLGRGMVDVARALDPENDALFTWWPPWRNMRQRNIGWRIDYILATDTLARRVTTCAVLAQVGTSDHAPVISTIE